MIHKYLVEIDGATFYQCFKDCTFDFDRDQIFPLPTVNIRNIEPIDVEKVLIEDRCKALEACNWVYPLRKRSREACFEKGYEEGLRRMLELLRYEQ